ncbi:hypothetical protein [Nesterenkonia sp. CF4.4]|uniref:hypothetical protein n=1 Tax=Nesterenkonia sp. CF4.4 TaxID=3373079 RepID=UPI003EE5C5AA
MTTQMTPRQAPQQSDPGLSHPRPPDAKLLRAKDLWDSSGSPTLLDAGQWLEVEDIGRRLSAMVDAGALLRLRRGIYIDPSTWLQTAPWDRHLIAAAAVTLQAPHTHFCRTTALAMHGFDLLRPPDAVTVRTARNDATGLHSAPALTGRASASAVERLLRAHSEADGGPRRRAALSAIGTRHHQYPRAFRDELREGLGQAWVQHYESALIRQQFPAPEGFDPSITAGMWTWLEPLGLVLADTVPRMSFAEAVAVLDTYRAGRFGAEAEPGGTLPAVEPWLQLVTSARGRTRWAAAWEFADAGAESAGESWARVRMAELGFAAPELQRRFLLPDGSTCRTDFYWKGPGVVGEFDGLKKYLGSAMLSGSSPGQVVVAEKHREDGLRALGLKVVRFTWADLADPIRLQRLLSAADVPLTGRFTGADVFYRDNRRAGRTRRAR